MGRPLNKRNFGNITDPGPQLECFADIGGGEELCWIQSQRGTNKFNLASVAGGATPTREGIARLANEAVGAVSLNNMVVTVQIADGATGTGETLTASMEADAVSINAIGAGYAVSDVLTLTGGTFSSAATADVDTLSTIAAQDETVFEGTGANGTFVGGDGAGGTAYVAAQTITLTDGTVITVDSVDGNDDVLTFDITSASTTGFVGVGTTLAQASSSGSGTGFTLTMDTNNQGVFGISVNVAGVYTVLATNPSATTTGGLGTGATVDVDGWAVESVAVGAGGSGFTTEPDVSFTGGGGVGASATSTLTGDAINTIVIVSGGSGYTAIPTVAATQVVEEVAARIHGHKVYTFSGNGFVWVLGTDAGSIVAQDALPLIEAEVQFDGE